jgi:hypothetical protein
MQMLHGTSHWFEWVKNSLSQRALTTLIVGLRERLDGEDYHVKNADPPEVLASFEEGVKAGGRFQVTLKNATALLRLAEEFGYGELAARCRPLGLDVNPGVYEFAVPKTRSLQGIIYFQSLVRGRAPVTVTAASVEAGFAVESVLDLTSESLFQSKDQPQQWICWDFREHRVVLTQIIIQNGGRLKSWFLEGSPNAWSWVDLQLVLGNNESERTERTHSTRVCQ